MKTKENLFTVSVIVLGSLFISGCSNGGELLRQSLKKTAPTTGSQELGTSFAPVQSRVIDPYGVVLTTQDGSALYTYANDSEGVSTCYDECAIAWPPFLINFEEDVSGVYGVIERTDGSLQVTYNALPLYTYVPDAQHTVTGDGKNGLWNVVTLSE